MKNLTRLKIMDMDAIAAFLMVILYRGDGCRRIMKCQGCIAKGLCDCVNTEDVKQWLESEYKNED